MSVFRTEQELRAEYMKHVSPEIQEIFSRGKPLTSAEWRTLPPMNSYERQLLLPLADDETFAGEAMDCLVQAGWHKPVVYSVQDTYEQAIRGIFAWGLAERLLARIQESQDHSSGD
jgi:hypothetical protein